MKIAFFIFSLNGGGAERVTSYLSNHWVEKGHDVIIYTLTEASEADYSLHPAVRRIHLTIQARHNIPGAGLLNSVKRILALRTALKAEKPDGLISMMTKSNALAIPACLGIATPCLCAERNNPREAYAGSVWHLVRKITYPWAYAVSVQSRIAQTWIKNNTRAKSVHIIPNPVQYPLNPGYPNLQTSPFEKHKIVLAVGRLETQKQFEHAIQAFSRLQTPDTQWHLVILGEGSEREKLQQLVSSLGMEAHISLPGRAGNVGDWYSLASLLVMSSRFEGFPNVLVEAMSYGVPVVSYDCETGPADIIQNGVNGYLVNPDSIDELSDKMQLLLNDPEARTAMSAAARHVQQTYGLERISNQWLKALDLQETE